MDMAHTALALQANWRRLQPLIRDAVPMMGGTYTEDDLLAEVLAGRMTFWPGQKSFLIAALECFPRLTRVNVLLGAGDAAEADFIGEHVLEWAKTMGATQIVAEVRPGLERWIERGRKSANEFKRRRTVYVRNI